MTTFTLPRLNKINDAVAIINHVCNQCESFKIGKTHNIEERIIQPDYKGVYSNIERLYSSKSKELVSYMESILIDACLEDVHGLCDNIKDGAQSVNDSMADSDTYHVYIV